MFNLYPYINENDLNLDYLLLKLKSVETSLKNFVALNTIKYANPIQWNITMQYEMNTVVIDPVTGTAYLSVAPVPSGVALSNTDYWTAIFTLNLLSANQNITLRDDSNNVLATFESEIGDWIIWNYMLYKVTRHIDISNAYVVGYNLERFTVELFIREYINNVKTIIGDLDNLTTTDKTNIVSAINELNSIIGNLTDLTTTDKTSIVNAINENVQNIENILTTIGNASIFNVKDYGAVGDNSTDDTQAIKDAVADANIAGGVVYFPTGQYKITDTIEFSHYGITVCGENVHSTYIMQYADKTALKFGDGLSALVGFRIENIGIIFADSGTPSNTTYGIDINYTTNSTINNCIISEFGCCIYASKFGNSFITDVGCVNGKSNGIGLNIGDASVSSAVKNFYVGFYGNAVSTGIGIVLSRGLISDIVFEYIDIGNGYRGIVIDGTDSMSSTSPHADIRLKDIIVDGSQNAGISIKNIVGSGNISIDGGWLNCARLNTSYGILIDGANHISIANVIFQQLLDDLPSWIGLNIVTCTDLTIRGCKFINLLQVITCYNLDRFNFSDNYITQYPERTSTNYCIDLSQSSNLIIKGNIIDGTYYTKININNTGDKSIITDNIIMGGGTPITDAHTTQIIDNNLT